MYFPQREKPNSDVKVLYITRMDNEQIRRYYKYKAQLSLAGQRKMRSVLNVLGLCGVKTDVLSPLPVKPAKAFSRARLFIDQMTGASIWVPPLAGGLLPKAICRIFVILSASIWALKAAIENSYDLVIFYNYTPDTFIPSLIFKVLYKIPVIIEAEEDLLYDPNLLFPLRIFSMVASRIPILDASVCVNQSVSDKLICKHSLILPGIAAADPETELRLLSMPLGQVSSLDVYEHVVFFSGRLDFMRGIDVFMRIALEFDRIGTKATFWICGWSSEAQIRRVQMKVRSINSRLKNIELLFLGTLPHDEYLSRLSQASVAFSLLSSRYYFSSQSFPSKIVEYLAAGKVVLCTQIAATSVLPKDCVVFLETEDPKKIASTLDQVLRNYGDYILKGKLGRDWIRTHATFDAWSKSLLELLSKVIPGNAQNE